MISDKKPGKLRVRPIRNAINMGILVNRRFIAFFESICAPDVKTENSKNSKLGKVENSRWPPRWPPG